MSSGAVVLAVIVGGITRLTQSGLSITEWNPVRGVLPPLGPDAWDRAFQSYLRIPEAQTVHRGITLGQFQALYWWEWIHRLLARGVGLVLAIPYFWLLIKGRIRPGFRLRLGMLPVLTLAQGVLGWYMVKSGLEVRTDVSPYRLAAHLGLALAIFVIAVWSALTLGRSAGSADPGPRFNGLGRAGKLAVAFTLITMISGAFVAGLDAGKVYNTFPLMGGRLVPPGYLAVSSWWRNAFENPAAAQFHHRILTIGTGLGLLALAWAARHSGGAALQRSGSALGVAVIAQLALGVATLLLAVPPALGVLHQLGALALLTTVLLVTHQANWSGREQSGWFGGA
jgi:cytochrome c oxidase assembly protein subunit 15